MKDTDQPILHKDGVSYILPFILVTCCFALWGFANDITNPMVKAFSKIFRMSVTDGALVQVAFYGGYFAMAFPAAMFIRKYSSRTKSLCRRSPPILPCKNDRQLLSFLISLFHSDLRTLILGDQFQSIYFVDGNRSHRHPTAQSGSVF